MSILLNKRQCLTPANEMTNKQFQWMLPVLGENGEIYKDLSLYRLNIYTNNV